MSQPYFLSPCTVLKKENQKNTVWIFLNRKVRNDSTPPKNYKTSNNVAWLSFDCLWVNSSASLSRNFGKIIFRTFLDSIEHSLQTISSPEAMISAKYLYSSSQGYSKVYWFKLISADLRNFPRYEITRSILHAIYRCLPMQGYHP